MSAKSTKEFLLDMGFTGAKIEKAISACGDNVEQAMEWLLSHADDEDSSKQLSENASTEAKSSDEVAIDEPMVEDKNEPPVDEDKKESPMDEDKKESPMDEDKKESPMDEDKKDGDDEDDESVAKSIKCDEFGMPRYDDEILYLKDLEAKLKERRKEKEEEERKEAIEREKKRIQMSREIADTKRRVQEEEMKRAAMERRREKMEDKMARERVKEQIERDRQARKEMFGGGSATKSPETSIATTGSVASSAISVPIQKKEYDTARLQIRLPSGTPLVQEFKAKESLSAVRLWVGLNRKDKDPPPQSFHFSTTFPRKTFSDEDMDKPLNILGLVPSAVLVVTDI
ncbi:UBX domain-containing protein 1-B [Armadillidium nasatum]|uniref:UBX domain-containing protein 1-B n=1 Tax=Armadillidium nasatum TaxID=96803 RepID=A0A5N5SQN1_9CRUS|nr:UBX domain-containing protein 1-B [Armadillidium nasatum]